ncbi:MAG: diguanylate cyclase [Cyanobacteria bacterium P01_H01_bin.119]
MTIINAAIVCVDDEWFSLKSLANQLKRSFGSDYDIEIAQSGEEALNLCAELTALGKAIPVIISDQDMDGIKGDALLIQLHQQYPSSLKIMLTGNADADAVGNVANASALYRYIRKPWDATDLVLTITEALRSFQQDQQLEEQNQLLKTINKKLENSLSLLLATLEATAEGLLVLDSYGKVVIFNQKFKQIWNLPNLDIAKDETEILEKIIARLAPSDAHCFQQLIAEVHRHHQAYFHLKDNTIIDYHLHLQELEGQTVGQVWSFRDVTLEKQAEADIKHQASHDQLTNLPNRSLFDRALTAALEQADNRSSRLAVMFLDLDRFKHINDTWGHTAGDLLLKSVVQRLLTCIREVDTLARWGGDEFVLLLPGLSGLPEASLIADRLIQVLKRPFDLESGLLNSSALTITVSIGIAFYPDGGTDADTLLQNADLALYAAKSHGRNNYQYYSAALRRNAESI